MSGKRLKATLKGRDEREAESQIGEQDISRIDL